MEICRIFDRFLYTIKKRQILALFAFSKLLKFGDNLAVYDSMMILHTILEWGDIFELEYKRAPGWPKVHNKNFSKRQLNRRKFFDVTTVHKRFVLRKNFCSMTPIKILSCLGFVNMCLLSDDSSSRYKKHWKLHVLGSIFEFFHYCEENLGSCRLQHKSWTKCVKTFITNIFVHLYLYRHQSEKTPNFYTFWKKLQLGENFFVL